MNRVLVVVVKHIEQVCGSKHAQNLATSALSAANPSQRRSSSSNNSTALQSRQAYTQRDRQRNGGNGQAANPNWRLLSAELVLPLAPETPTLAGYSSEETSTSLSYLPFEVNRRYPVQSESIPQEACTDTEHQEQSTRCTHSLKASLNNRA